MKAAPCTGRNYPAMSDTPHNFRTGPLMIRPALGIVLIAGSLALAASQAWRVIQHFSGTRALAPNEPVARLVVVAIFVVAAAGIAIAMLERRNAAVDLDDDGLTVQRWWGGTRRLVSDEIEAIILLRPAAKEGDLPFHRLALRLVNGRTVRIAGGPWPEGPEVLRLRRKLIGRIGLAGQNAAPARWCLIFGAERVTWT